MVGAPTQAIEMVLELHDAVHVHTTYLNCSLGYLFVTINLALSIP